MNAAPLAPRRYLLVEDNDGDADLVVELLEQPDGQPHQVVRARDIQSALGCLDAEAFDAVLLDLFLPDASGLECVSAIRGRRREVPIVVLTGVEDGALALRCLAAGAQDYLPKQDIRNFQLNRAIHYAITRALEASQRRRADALQEHLAAIVEASRDAIISTTVEGDITSWNRGAERIFGFERHEAIGRPLSELLLPVASGDRLEESLLALGASAQPSQAPRELEWLRKDGTPVTVAIVGCDLVDGRGSILGYAAICRDVTAARLRDQELALKNVELAEHSRKMQALAARLNAVREDERTRISREVHDELGQCLTGVKMDLRWISKRIAEGANTLAITKRLEDAEVLVDRTLEGIHRIATELRPSALDALGLASALRDEARRFSARTGVKTEVIVETAENPSTDQGTAIFRIFQELLTNVARHAAARSVQVCLRENEGSWLLSVVDDGVGIRAAELRPPSSLGLLGMEERAREVGGSIEVESMRTGGTRATVRVPSRPAEASCDVC